VSFLIADLGVMDSDAFRRSLVPIDPGTQFKCVQFTPFGLYLQLSGYYPGDLSAFISLVPSGLYRRLIR